MAPTIVRAKLERFGIYHLPTRTYIVNVLSLDSADSFLDFTKEVTRTISKKLRAASKDTNAAQHNQPGCSMKTMADIAVITLFIKTPVDLGVPADNQLLMTLHYLRLFTVARPTPRRQT